MGVGKSIGKMEHIKKKNIFLKIIILVIAFTTAAFFFLNVRTIIIININNVESSSNMVKLYWACKDTTNYRYNEENSSEQILRNDSNFWAVYPSEVQRIRLDLGEYKGETWKINNVILLSKYGVEKLQKQDIIDSIENTNSVKTTIDDNSIEIYSEEDDPYIEFFITKGKNLWWKMDIVLCLIVLAVICLGYLLLTYNTKLIKKEIRNTYIILVIDTIVLALLIDGVLLKILYLLTQNTNLQMAVWFKNGYHFLFWRFLFWCILILPILICAYYGIEFFFNNRYKIFAVVFLALCLCGYHGQSIGFLNKILYKYEEGYEDTTLLGIDRGLRGDAWAVGLPFSLAQKNAPEKFKYYNDNLMLNGEDVMVAGKLPSISLLSIADPMNWGYFFLSDSSAVAFAWWLPLFLAILSSMDMLYIMTGNKRLAIVFSFIISCSPAVAWWSGTPLLIIMYSGQYAIVGLYRMLNTKIIKDKLLFACTVIWASLVYFFTLYPAWMIPFAYVYLAILVGIVSKVGIKNVFNIENAIIVGISILVIIAVGIYFIIKSGNAISIQMGTIYPGKVRYWERLDYGHLLLQLLNILMGMFGYIDYLNESEISQFIGMGLWVIILVIFSKINKRSIKRSSYIVPLLVVDIFLIAICFLPEFEILNKVLLLSYSYPRRIITAFGYGEVLLCCLVLNDSSLKIRPQNAIVISIVIMMLLIIAIVKNDVIVKYISNDSTVIMFVLMIIVMWWICGYAILTKRHIKGALCIYLSVILFASISVNPISRGIDALNCSSMILKVKEIRNENINARWLVSGDVTVANMVASCGVKRISGTYIYPDLELNKYLDNNMGIYEDLNRYMHLDVSISERKAYSINGDNVSITISKDIAKNLNIGYWVTMKNLDNQQGYTKIYEDSVWKIYKIN